MTHSRMQDEILSAVRAEIDRASDYYSYCVVSRSPVAGIWKVVVELDTGRRTGLDETLEGSTAWWPGPPKGAADVLSVVPEEETIHLRFATSPPPERGGTIRIYPPVYLRALDEHWSDFCSAEESLAFLDRLESGRDFDDSRSAGEPAGVLGLRPSQRAAFRLPGHNVSFLFGPPGTGKTFTLGALLAQFLVRFPSARVLLLSTTNVAVDLALVRTDKSLETLARERREASEARRSCRRLGNHFRASNYAGREHLIPSRDCELLRQLTELEAKKPPAGDAEAYATWKQEEEGVRARIRVRMAEAIESSRLVAMTTTAAVFTRETLRRFAPFDLVVFDEASQVGLAHALALAPLGRSVLFAGDPKQLAPIVQAKSRFSRAWLGRSVFAYMDPGDSSTEVLVEQSRMAGPISRVVSNVYYDGRLVVAEDCLGNPAWNRERKLARVPGIADRAIVLVPIEAEGHPFSAKYRGPIRYESAELIQDLVLRLHQSGCPEILIVTPFRAQRTLIRQLLRTVPIPVRVSTAHKAQGGECHTVIFDPAFADNDFLRTEDADRLVNVALSRAKARLILILSPRDRKNPIFGRIATVIESQERCSSAASITKYAMRPDFPDCAIGKVVRIKSVCGRVIGVQDRGRKLILECFETGAQRAFLVEYLRASARNGGAEDPRRTVPA